MLKQRFIVVITFIFFTVTFSSLHAQQKNEKQMDEMWGKTDSKQKINLKDNAAWFAEAKYAMFIHWGLFSKYANQWQGKTYYGIGEWLMYLAKTNVSEYEKITAEFNPVKFSAKEWVQLAKDAGMKYIVITAKHHDGFAMFKSANPYNVVDATPFKRDPMKELAQACKEAGIKLGFYYSQTQDWHEINDWSKDLKKISFEEYFKNKCEPQVEELVRNYGDLLLVWFDTPNDMTKEQSLALVDLVKKNQPKALINSRIGNGVGDYDTYGDHEIPPSNVKGLWEAVNTSNDSWGYAWYDENWKGPTEIATSLISVIARGGNFMLNIGPKADGTVPATNAQFLRTAGQWIKKHAAAIYGVQPSPWQAALPWGDCTLAGNKLNLFVYNWNAGANIYLPGLKTKLKSVTIQSTNEKLQFKHDVDGWLRIQLPLRQKKELIEVIEVELVTKPDVDITAGIAPTGITTLVSDFATTSGCRKGKSGWMEKFGEWKHRTDIRDWKTDTSSASWLVTVKTPGKYFVNMEYNAWKEEDGGEWDLITEDGETMRMYTTETTGASMTKIYAAELAERSRPRFRNVRMGVIEIKKAGKQTLLLRAASKPKGTGMQLHAVYLQPVE